MKTGLFRIFATALFIVSCSKDDINDDIKNDHNGVLLLQVDYLENSFEAGKELTFLDSTLTFTIEKEYDPPGDFGNIKLIYKELQETLFDGTIIWLGLGEMNFPSNLKPATQFDVVLTQDFVMPRAGFEDVFNPGNQTYDYEEVWQSVQNLVKVRAYLKSNPNSSVKLFLYTPSVGIGNPADWDWIIFVKN